MVRASNPPKYWLEDEFAALADGIVYYCNLTVVLSIGILVAGVYLLLWFRKGGNTPLAGPMLRLAAAAAGVWSGLFMIAALTFSKAPRLDALSIQEWKLLGVIASFVLLGIAAYEYVTTFRSL